MIFLYVAGAVLLLFAVACLTGLLLHRRSAQYLTPDQHRAQERAVRAGLRTSRDVVALPRDRRPR